MLDRKPVLHKSMLGLFDKCGMAYMFRYIEGKRIPPGTAAVVGISTHKAAAVDLTAKRDSGFLLADSQVRDVARDKLNETWQAEGVTLNLAEKFMGEKRTRGEAVDAVVALAGLHHAKLAPTISPKHIERPFTVEMQNFPVDLSGTIDLQEADGTLRDLKTTGKAPGDDAANKSLDLTCYGLAARALDHVAPARLALDFLVRGKKPRLETQTTTRTEVAYRAFLMRVEAVSRAIEAGAFTPCSPDFWMCSDKWCGYWNDVCPYGRKASVTI